MKKKKYTKKIQEETLESLLAWLVWWISVLLLLMMWLLQTLKSNILSLLVNPHICEFAGVASKVLISFKLLVERW